MNVNSRISIEKKAEAETECRGKARDSRIITRTRAAGIRHSSSGTTDEDGDCINCEEKLELRNTGDDTVRIQVPVGIKPCEAVRVLRKVADWIESKPSLLRAKRGRMPQGVARVRDRYRAKPLLERGGKGGSRS